MSYEKLSRAVARAGCNDQDCHGDSWIMEELEEYYDEKYHDIFEKIVLKEDKAEELLAFFGCMDLGVEFFEQSFCDGTVEKHQLARDYIGCFISDIDPIDIYIDWDKAESDVMDEYRENEGFFFKII